MTMVVSLEAIFLSIRPHGAARESAIAELRESQLQVSLRVEQEVTKTPSSSPVSTREWAIAWG